VVVALQVAVRRRLHADQQTELVLDAADVGLEDVEVRVAVVVAGVEVDVGDAGLAACRAHDLHHLVDRLLVGVVDAEVEAHRAELAVALRRLLRPVLADLGLVDPEVGALQRADAGHRFAGRRWRSYQPGRGERSTGTTSTPS
jgi:hypothetical protein